MEKLPAPFTVSPTIAAVMSIENYPLNIAPNIDLMRVQRVADEMLQFKMLADEVPGELHARRALIGYTEPPEPVTR